MRLGRGHLPAHALRGPRVARAGGASPHGQRYRSFGHLSLTSCDLPDGGRYHRLAFTARLADGRKCLVVEPSYAAARQIVTTGATHAGAVLDDFVPSRLGMGLCCVAHLRRGTRRQRRMLFATEDVVIVGERLRDGGRVADLPRISRLRAPAAAHTHLGVVALELTDGSGALVTCTTADAVEVFARGGPAPGLPAGLHRFGPPLSTAACRTSGPSAW